MSLREHLKANLADGCEAGTLTVPTAAFLDQVTEEVVHYLMGGDDRLKTALLDYFGAVEVADSATDTDPDPLLRPCTLCGNLLGDHDAAQARECRQRWDSLLAEFIECVCAETSVRNCPVHANASDDATDEAPCWGPWVHDDDNPGWESRECSHGGTESRRIGEAVPDVGDVDGSGAAPIGATEGPTHGTGERGRSTEARHAPGSSTYPTADRNVERYLGKRGWFDVAGNSGTQDVERAASNLCWFAWRTVVRGEAETHTCKKPKGHTDAHGCLDCGGSVDASSADTATTEPSCPGCGAKLKRSEQGLPTFACDVCQRMWPVSYFEPPASGSATDNPFSGRGLAWLIEAAEYFRYLTSYDRSQADIGDAILAVLRRLAADSNTAGGDD